MLKKIVLATILISMLGILVAGAVIRTMDRTRRVAEAHGPGYGWGYGETGAYSSDGAGQGRGGYGQGDNRGGYDGQGRENASGDQTGTGQANVEEWLTLQGTVVSVDADTLVVQTANGEQVTMENRPWWFAQEQGFSAQVGDQVMLVGFYDGDAFEVEHIENLTTDQTVLVRDENGRPMWAGRGRRGG